jgi:hypothetical protein
MFSHHDELVVELKELLESDVAIATVQKRLHCRFRLSRRPALFGSLGFCASLR